MTNSHVSASACRFTGKERDTESGLDYFGARYYGSSMGRFMSPDPSALAFANPANPQSLNLYSYALNNPLRLIDPTGLTVCDGGISDAGPNQGNEDYYDTDSEQECRDSGGTPWEDQQSVTVTANANDDSAAYYSDYSSQMVPVNSDPMGTICGAVPSGTVVSVSGNGNYAGTAGSLDLVTNGRTGEVTGFFSPGYFAGAATAGGSLTGGYTFGNLGAGNSNFAGGFSGLSGGAGIYAGSAATSSGGPASPFSGISPTASGHVTTVSAGVQTSGRALSLNTTFSLPTQLGKFWTLQDPMTALVFLANQACEAAGH